MRIRVKLYGMLTIGVRDPDHRVEVSLPGGSDVAGLLQTFCETSSLFDPRSCIAMIDGTKVPLSRPLKDGEEVHLYHLFTGG
jgi:hypothetical protein